MIVFLVITGFVAVALVGRWLAKAHAELAWFRARLRETWQQLADALAARREIVPYLVTSAPPGAGATVEVIGNACDLASHVTGVREAARAEARLGAAVGKLLAVMDGDPEARDSEGVRRLRNELLATEARIGFLCERYNEAAEAMNTRLAASAGPLFVQFGLFRAAERFETGEAREPGQASPAAP